MATTVYARRVQELKLRISRTKDPNFQTIYNAFDELCGCKRLSRHNIIWARKKLVEFRDRWTDNDSRRLLDKLALRVEHAATKWQKREDARVAAKLAGTGKRIKKEKQQTAAQEPPSPSIDPWEA